MTGWLRFLRRCRYGSDNKRNAIDRAEDPQGERDLPRRRGCDQGDRGGSHAEAQQEISDQDGEEQALAKAPRFRSQDQEEEDPNAVGQYGPNIRGPGDLVAGKVRISKPSQIEATDGGTQRPETGAAQQVRGTRRIGLVVLVRRGQGFQRVTYFQNKCTENCAKTQRESFFTRAGLGEGRTAEGGRPYEKLCLVSDVG